jgi:hypothetical protein
MSSSSDNVSGDALGSPKTAEKAEKEASSSNNNNSPQPNTSSSSSSGSERKSLATGTQGNSTTTPDSQSFSSPEVQKTVKGRSANALSVTKGVGVRPYLAVLSLFLASHLVSKYDLVYCSFFLFPLFCNRILF